MTSLTSSSPPPILPAQSKSLNVVDDSNHPMATRPSIDTDLSHATGSDESVSTLSSFASSSRSSFSNSDTSSLSSGSQRLIIVESLLKAVNGNDVSPVSASSGNDATNLDEYEELNKPLEDPFHPASASPRLSSLTTNTLLAANSGLSPSSILSSSSHTTARHHQSLPSLNTTPILSRELTPTGPTTTLSSLRLDLPSAPPYTVPSHQSERSNPNSSLKPSELSESSSAIANWSSSEGSPSPTTAQDGSLHFVKQPMNGGVRHPQRTFGHRASSSLGSSLDAVSTGTGKSTSHFAQLPSPTYTSSGKSLVRRPGSSGSGAYSMTGSTGSGSARPWVRDAETSSICSRRSSCWSSSNQDGDDADEEEEDGEVYKVGEDGHECELLAKAESEPQLIAIYSLCSLVLDERPEPPGAKIWIDRDDPKELIVNVTLPGFELENITVAFRRHRKLHVIADKDVENGGYHYERTITLGPDVSSRSNRAAFDGTTLRVFIERRIPRAPATTASSPSNSLLEPLPAFATSIGSPTPSVSSLASNESNSNFAILSQSPTEQPIAMCSTGPLDKTNAKGKPLTGPEGARAAARAARDEAMQRAKEAAKALPKVGRRLPFRREKDKSPELSLTSANDKNDNSATSTSPSSSLQIPPGRSGTIKGRSPSPASISSDSTATSNIFSERSTSTRSDVSSPTTSIDSAPSRPKFTGSNLTLKGSDKTSFFEASLRAFGFDDSAATPKVEKNGMNFTTTSTSPSSTPTTTG